MYSSCASSRQHGVTIHSTKNMLHTPDDAFSSQPLRVSANDTPRIDHNLGSLPVWMLPRTCSRQTIVGKGLHRCVCHACSLSNCSHTHSLSVLTMACTVESKIGDPPLPRAPHTTFVPAASLCPLTTGIHKLSHLRVFASVRLRQCDIILDVGNTPILFVQTRHHQPSGTCDLTPCAFSPDWHLRDLASPMLAAEPVSSLRPPIPRLPISSSSNKCVLHC